MVYLPHWPKISGIRNFAKTGLEPVYELLDKLGNPQNNLPPVIHFAGTNGKGSTIAFTRAMLEAAGKKCHVYTSPHLTHFNERIVLAGEQISDDNLYKLMEEVRIKTGDSNATFFEATTCAALLAFSRTKADYVLLETGLGGRLDATNVVDNPLATVITPIGMDHTEFLGNTIGKIAAEKAGILKPNIPNFIGLQNDDAYQVIEDKANQLSCPLTVFNADFSVDIDNDDNLVYLSSSEEEVYNKPSLIGNHQYINAGLAIALCKHLGISQNHLNQGITNAKWPARMEHITNGKMYNILPPNWQLWMDGGHNKHASNAVAQEIQKWPTPTYLILGLTRGRDAADFVKPLTPYISNIKAVKVQSEPNAVEPEEIVKQLSDINIKSQPYQTIEEAVLDITNNNPLGNILVAGSLFLRGDL